MFKEKYEWESEETMKLAGHLLEIMPEQAKQQRGLETLIKVLDKKIADKELTMVDQEKLLKAIEQTVPPEVAPVMSKQIKKCIKAYKGQVD